MAEKKLKTKDMVIAVFCTLLAVLCIVFYFLPAITVKHTPDLNIGDNAQSVSYSAWEMTKAVFVNNKDWGSHIVGLIYIKDVFGIAVALSGILMPLGLICTITTAVFAYLSWFKGEKFKKFCFLFSLLGMMFTTITLISTWFIAIQLRTENVYIDYFSVNMKGGIAYGSFVSLILSFVVAIIACAYNYFLDNFDVDEDEEDDGEEKSLAEEAKSALVAEVKSVEPETTPEKVSTTKSANKTTPTKSKALGAKSTTSKSKTTTKTAATAKKTTAKKA